MSFDDWTPKSQSRMREIVSSRPEGALSYTSRTDIANAFEKTHPERYNALRRAGFLGPNGDSAEEKKAPRSLMNTTGRTDGKYGRIPRQQEAERRQQAKAQYNADWR